MIGIYKITNKINGKSYIGQSNNIERRLKEHKYISSETNKSLKKAYKKYGKENFEFSILEQCKLEELDEKEIYYISTLKPKYNRTSGGNGSANHIVTKDLKELLIIIFCFCSSVSFCHCSFPLILNNSFKSFVTI